MSGRRQILHCTLSDGKMILKKRRTYVEIDGVWPIDTSKYIDIDRFEVARIAVYIIQMRA